MRIQDAHNRVKEGFAQTILIAEASISVYEDRIRELRASITIMRQCMADERLPGTTREADRQRLLTSKVDGAGDTLRAAMSRTDAEEPAAEVDMTAAVAAAIGNGATVVKD